jgi:hypothetical protein
MFIDSLLAEYDLTDGNTVKTPIDRDHPVSASTDVHAPISNLTQLFQCLVGLLLFLQLCSRPDISFAVLLLSQHCALPEPHHFATAKHVLCYLKGTHNYRLHYGGTDCHPGYFCNKKKTAIKTMKNISNRVLNVLAESQQPSFG